MAATSDDLSPILSTGVSCEDLLITLNMLLEDAASNDSTVFDPAIGEKIPSIQESLDQLVESLGPEGEGLAITKEQLEKVLQSLPKSAWGTFVGTLAKSVEAAGMGGGKNADGAGSAAQSASSTNKAESASSSSSSGGGGLDLSISGFSIKPPNKK